MIDGNYKVGNNKYLYLNSKTGAGFPELIKLLGRFMKIKSSTMEFPSFSKEDIKQEILMLAFEAIQRYDSTKNANLITFLQNHVQNRLINKCKFFSEKCRSSTHTNTQIKKLRCNACRQFFRTEEESEVQCPHCYTSGSLDSNMWKRYNLISVPGQFFEAADGSTLFAEIDPDLQQFTVIGTNQVNSDARIDIENFISKLPEQKKSIILLLSQGFTNLEIGKQLHLSVAEVKQIIKNISVELEAQLNEEKA